MAQTRARNTMIAKLEPENGKKKDTVNVVVVVFFLLLLLWLHELWIH